MISSATPAEIADSLRDSREERLERVCKEHEEQAKSNIEARLLAAYNEHQRYYPACEVMSESVAMLDHLGRERLADAMWSRDACALGEILLESVERYISEYFADHPEDVDDEAMMIAASGGDTDE